MLHSSNARLQLRQAHRGPLRPNPSLKRSTNGMPPGLGRGCGHIFRSPGLAACRRCPLSSNVRQHKAAAATSRKAAAAAQYQASTGARLAATRQSNVAVGSQSLTRSQASAFIGGRRERRAVQILEETAMGGKQAQPQTSLQRTRNSESAEAQNTKHEDWFAAPVTKFSSFLPLLAAPATIIFI